MFASAQAIFAPIVLSFARKYAEGLLGGIGIISTLVALIVAVWIPNGLTIDGALAWVVTPLIVWFITGFGGWLLTIFVIDKWLERKQEEKAIKRVQGGK